MKTLRTLPKSFIVLMSFSLSFVAVGIGCSGKRAGWVPVYPVKGTVTYNGAAVDGATITFYPVDSGKAEKVPGSYARTDDQGQFKLTTFNEGDGAPAGEFVVMVTKDVDENPPVTEVKKGEKNPKPKFKSYLPSFLAAPGKTPLRVTITSGSYNYHISLTDDAKSSTIKPK